MSAAPPTIISPAAWRYSTAGARIEGRPVVEILRRMLVLGIEADIREALSIRRGQRQHERRKLAA
jgi:hypothetical protein